MKSKSLIIELESLIESMKVKVNKVCTSKSGMTHITINSKYIETFKEKIGFSHPKKIINLNATIARKHRKQRTRDKEYIKEQILKILENSPSSTINIANNILLTLGHTLNYLKILEREEKVIRTGYENKIIWNILRSYP